MAINYRTGSFRLIQRLFGEGVLAGSSDAELLELFATARDPDAFAAIVARHGPMVWAVCRGRLGSSADADDAFQATFLALIKSAGSFSVGSSLGGWLYRVARRVARQVRLADARRRKREVAAVLTRESSAQSFAEQSEITRLIRQEIDRLPDRHRTPIVLCDLQGLSREEAARLLGWPAGTVAGRLARARLQLRERLERRGLAPSVALPLFSKAAPAAGAWRISLEAAIRTASALAAGSPATPAALDLAARADQAIIGAVKLSVGAGFAAIAIVGLVAARYSWEPQKAVAAPATAELSNPAAAAHPHQVSNPAALPDPDDPNFAGHFAGRVIGRDGQPIAGARIFIAQNDPSPAAAGPVRALSGADGRFEFDAADMTYIGIDGLPTRRRGLLIATADGYQPNWVATWGRARFVHVPLRSDPVKGADLAIRLSRDDVPIHGRLLDPEAKPLAGARIRLLGLKVARDGQFDADLKRFERTRGEAWPFNYDQALQPVILPGVATEAIADRDGRFRLAGLGRDRLAVLKITAPSMIDTYLEVMTRDAPDLVFGRQAILGAGFTFRMEPGRTVRGFVRDSKTNAPIAGMWVGQGRDALSGLTGSPSPFTSGPNGRYDISGIDPAIRDLEVMAVPRPGQPYFMAKAAVGEKSGAMIDCLRGIPFRLKLVDESGRPVTADVECRAVSPNPHAERLLPFEWTYESGPLSRAVMTAKGIYEGVAIAGPGAVLVKMPGGAGYRPAHVDPKAFFAPGKTDWTVQDLITAYGTDDTLIVGGAGVNQHDYAAIVLLNPLLDSKPLELSATVFRDRPRQVTILDPDGKPVVGVKTEGLTGVPWDDEPPLRAATVPITKLRPTRSRRITFVKEDRRLIGFLLARGDADAPYTVRLQPWATVTLRIVDEHGNPLPAKLHPVVGNQPLVALATNRRYQIANHDDPAVGWVRDMGSDREGRFRIERLVPGLRYSCDMYRTADYAFVGLAFENLVLKPGETRDLGDIRWQPPVSSNLR